MSQITIIFFLFLCTECEESKFACRLGEECIDKSKECDQRADCSDASDETNCTCKFHLSVESLIRVFCTAKGMCQILTFIYGTVFWNGKLGGECIECSNPQPGLICRGARPQSRLFDPHPITGLSTFENCLA